MRDVETNEEMLALVREGRPDQKIHEAFGFRMSKHGYYDVEVDMAWGVLPTVIEHCHVTIPYPIARYRELAGFVTDIEV